jgi:phage terminase large subunit-like protein
MAATWEDLTRQYGSPLLIPNQQLYDYISRSDVKESIIALSQVPGALQKRELWAEVRRRSKADLFWLSHYFLWDRCPFNETGDIDSNLIKWGTHKEVCELFVQKDDSKPISKQDWRKDRLLLYPRGSAKSTVDGHDCVSWILNFPFVRIGYMTAVSDLAEGFVSEIKGYFTIDPEKPSLMSIFFPEFCFEETKKGAANEFWCPVFLATGKKRKDPTILGLGSEASLSGWHFDVLKCDDLISTSNSTSEEQCRKTAKVFYINKKMLMAYGYCDMVGTRYHDSDIYGEIIEKNVGEIRKSNPKPGVELIENLTTGQVILIGRALTIKPETAKKLEQDGKQITYKEAGKDGCITLFPELLPYSKLMVDVSADEFAFESQMNQDPRPTGFTTFDRPLLLQATVHFEEIPVSGIRTNVWDFAYVAKEKRDYTTGAASIWSDSGVCYINDIVRDRFSPTDLAKAVVNLARKTHPVVVGIEDAPGCRFLEDTIINEARKTNDPQVLAVCSRIDWIPLDRSKDAKINRIKSLHPWLVEGRMKFSNHLPFLDVLYREFERCTMSATHDDLPDVVSFMPRFAPRVRQLIASQYQAPLSREDAIAQAQYNLLYGPWLGDSDYGADAYGNLGRGELISVPMEPESPEPEPELEAYSQIPGVISPLGSGLVG